MIRICQAVAHYSYAADEAVVLGNAWSTRRFALMTIIVCERDVALYAMLSLDVSSTYLSHTVPVSIPVSTCAFCKPDYKFHMYIS